MLAATPGGDRLAGHGIDLPRVVGVAGVAGRQQPVAGRVGAAAGLAVQLAQVLADLGWEQQALLRLDRGVVDVVVAAQHDRQGVVADARYRPRQAAHDERSGDRLEPAERLDRWQRRLRFDGVERARVAGEVDTTGPHQVPVTEAQAGK